MSFLFDRVAKLIVGTSSTEETVFDERFRIKFNIIKNGQSTPTLSTAAIYNLSLTDRKKLENVPTENRLRLSNGATPLILLLYAGYKESSGYELLYSGNITAVNTIYDGADYISTVTCGNGLTPLTNTSIEISYAAGIGTNHIVKQIADALKMDVSKSSNYLQTNVSFANGYSFSGLAKQAMDEMAAEAGFKWTVEKGQIVISKLNTNLQDEIIELSKDSGMIGIPTKSANQQVGDLFDEGNYDGWNIRSLLQPSIIPNRQIKVVSKEVTSTFLIDTVTHTGDTRGNDWVSVVETRAVGLGGL